MITIKRLTIKKNKKEDESKSFIDIICGCRTVGMYHTIDSGSIGSNRAEFEGDVRKRLEKSLREEGFVVEEFTAQITPPESLRKAIDAKNEAVQNQSNKVRQSGTC